jgi:hypothetical protein
MIKVLVPSTDGREISITPHTQPALKPWLEKRKLTLLAQASPKITVPAIVAAQCRPVEVHYD